MNCIKSFSKTFLIAGLALLTFTQTASAGEPFHPFWDPFYDFGVAIYNLFYGY